MQTYHDFLTNLRSSGFEAFCNALQSVLRDLSVPEGVVHVCLESLQKDAAFLHSFPEELAARLYEAAFDNEQLLKIVAGWLVDAPRPWLRAHIQHPHNESPVCLSSALHLSPDEELLLISGSRGELWSLRERKCLWSNERYIARDVKFTTDSQHIVGEDIDYGGMTDYNPYTVIFESKSGNEVFYEDQYRTVGTRPALYQTAEVVGGYEIKSIYDERTFQRQYWSISEGGCLMARLPARFKHCISALQSRDILTIEEKSFVVYEMVR